MIYRDMKFCYHPTLMHGASSMQFSTNCSYITMDVLFNGLLAKLPAIADSFFTNTTSAYIHNRGGWLGVS